ncbi:MAG: hypothetical protein AABZ74_06465, partial [Cyanobacteriota bacterium]
NFLGTNQQDLATLAKVTGGFNGSALGGIAGINANLRFGKSFNLFANYSYRISSSVLDWEAVIDKENKISLKNNSDLMAYRQLQIIGLSFGAGIGISF